METRTVGVPNSPSELLDMNVSSWEDNVVEQLGEHTLLEGLSLMVRLNRCFMNYYQNTVNKDNLYYNLITSGEVLNCYNTFQKLLGEQEELEDNN